MTERVLNNNSCTLALPSIHLQPPSKQQLCSTKIVRGKIVDHKKIDLFEIPRVAVNNWWKPIYKRTRGRVVNSENQI